MFRYSAIKGKGLVFLLLLWSLWFILMVVRMIMGPILPLIEDEFLVKHARATTLVSLFALSGAISTFGSGIFSGRVGYKKWILSCLGASVLVFLVIPQVRTFSQLQVLLCALGFVWGAYFPCVIPIVTSHFAPSVWGRALAIQDSGASLSALSAPLLAASLLKFATWRQFFYVFAAAYLAAGIAFFFFAKEVKVEQRLSGSLSNLLKGRSVWVLAAMWVCASGAFWGIYQIVPLYFTKELLLSTQYANTVFGLSRLGGVAFGITMGFVADRFNLKKSMFIVLCLTGLFTMFIGHTRLVVVEIAMFLQGTTIIGVFTIGLIAISRAFPAEERSMASALITTVAAVFGSGMLPYLFGIAGDHISFRFGILVFGSVVVLASGLIHFLRIPGRVDQAQMSRE